MKNCALDCSGIGNPEEFHDALVEALALPNWYGTNLDALYDCLTSITQETVIILQHFDQLDQSYAGFRAVFQDAQEDNPRIRICFQQND